MYRAFRAIPRRVCERGWPLVLLAMLGCRCGTPQGEVDGLRFVRCPQLDPPAAREVRAGQLTLRLADRVLEIAGPATLRIAAFTGPVGGVLGQAELAALERAGAQLALYLGGLGDDEASARQNLQALAALRVPTLFVAGGADRAPVIEAAFAALDATARDLVLHASGLREVRFATQRFVVVAGAALGRYARADDACGFAPEDLQAIRTDVAPGAAGQTWLLGWHAPAGQGVTDGLGPSDVGSRELEALGAALASAGGLFAYPEVQAGRARSARGAWVVPRLGRTGSQRADGSRIPARVTTLVWSASGLVEAP